MASFYFYVYFFLLTTISTCFGSETKFRSVRELEASMYFPVEGTPCVRLLTIKGEHGCANPGRQSVSAPIQRLTGANETLRGIRTVLLPPSQFTEFMQRLTVDQEVKKRVVGVMVEFQNLEVPLFQKFFHPRRNSHNQHLRPMSKKTTTGILWGQRFP